MHLTFTSTWWKINLFEVRNCVWRYGRWDSKGRFFTYPWTNHPLSTTQPSQPASPRSPRPLQFQQPSGPSRHRQASRQLLPFDCPWCPPVRKLWNFAPGCRRIEEENPSPWCNGATKPKKTHWGKGGWVAVAVCCCWFGWFAFLSLGSG